MSTTALNFDIFARDRASSTFRRVGDSVDGTRSSFSAFKTGLLGVGGAIAGLGILEMGKNMLSLGVSTAAANEQAQIAFTTMLGSGQKAKAFLEDLQSFAAKTPFEFPELQSAASSLISAGIEAKRVVPIMTTLGDVTSGMGTGAEGVKRATIALQQMNAAGRITGEDLNQLRDAGIPVYDLLASATGKSKEEVVALAQAGKLGATELGQMMKALETGAGLERFSGLMDKQSASLAGMWSTFKDVLGQGLAQAITPLIPLIKDGLGGATAFLAAVVPAVATGFEAISGVFSGGQGDGMVATLQSIGVALHSSLGPAVSAVVAAFQQMWTVVQPIIAQVVGYIRANWGAISGTVQAIFSQVTAIVTTALQIIATYVRGVTATIKAIWSRWGTDIMTVAGAAFRAVSAIVRGALTVIQGILKTVLSALRGDWSGVLNGLKTIASGAWTAIKGVFEAALQILVTAVSSGLKEIVGFFKGLPGKAVAALKDLAGLLLKIGSDAIAGLLEGITTKAREVLDYISELGGKIRDAIASKLEIFSPSRVMAEVGENVIEGIIVGLERKRDRLKSTLDSVAQEMLQFGDSVAGNFRSDVFGEGATVRSMLGGLRGDAREAQLFQSALRNLRGRGVDEGLFQAIAASGNLDLASDLAFGGGKRIREAEKAFARRERLTGRLGSMAGNTVYGDDISRLERRLAEVVAELKKLPKETGKEVGEAIDGAAAGAKRRSR